MRRFPFTVTNTHPGRLVVACVLCTWPFFNSTGGWWNMMATTRPFTTLCWQLNPVVHYIFYTRLHVQRPAHKYHTSHCVAAPAAVAFAREAMAPITVP